jgi:hypothetical protein
LIGNKSADRRAVRSPSSIRGGALACKRRRRMGRRRMRRPNAGQTQFASECRGTSGCGVRSRAVALRHPVRNNTPGVFAAGVPCRGSAHRQ